MIKMASENPEKMLGVTKKAVAVAVLGMVISALLWPQQGKGATPYWPMRFRFPFTDDQPWSYMGTSVFPAIIGSFSIGLALVFICGLINYGVIKGWWKTTFSQRELALIMSLAPLGGIFGGGDLLYPWSQTHLLEGFKPGTIKDPSWWNLIPDIVFGPKDASVWSYVYVPGEAIKPRYLPWQIPWMAILPNILTFYVFFASMLVCLICASMLMRYICIKTEYLAFPFNEVYGGFVDLASSNPKTKRLGMFSKPFLIGFLASFIWQFSLWGAYYWVMLITGQKLELRYQGYLPDPTTGQASTILAWPVWDFTHYDLIDWAPLVFSAGLWEIGWAALLPTNILLSGLIGFLAMWVVFPPVATYVLNGNPMEPGESMRKCLKRLDRGWYYGGVSVEAVFLGACLAVIVAIFVKHRQESLTILKSIVKEPVSEFDPDRPLPYRWIWWIMIASFLLWYLIGVGLFKMYPIPLLIMGLGIVILFTAAGKIVSEAGGWYGSMFSYDSAEYAQLVGGILTVKCNLLASGRSLTMSDITTLWITKGARSIINWMEIPPWYSLYTMKMADSKRINKKKMLIAVIGIFALALILSEIFYEIKLAYDVEPTTKGQGIVRTLTEAMGGEQIDNMWRLYSRCPEGSMYTIIASFSIILALSILQNYIGILRPLSIGGLIVGLKCGHGIWGAWLVALILKYLVLKVGGVKLYEERLKPISLGFFGGGLLAYLAGLIGAVLG